MVRHAAPGRTRLVPLDTSALFALADSGDTNHRAANRILARLRAERWNRITTNYVVAETHALMLNRLGRATAERFLPIFFYSSSSGIHAAATL